MRGAWLIAGSLGLVLAAYAGDRMLTEVLIGIGASAGTDGTRELGLTLALAGRLVILVGLAGLFVLVRSGASKWAVVAAAAMGAAAGVAGQLLLALDIALGPDGLAWVAVMPETAPFLDGTSVLLPWTGVGLLVIGLLGLIDSDGDRRLGSVPPPLLPLGAAALILLSYPVDGLWEATAVELASGLDGYPAFLLLGLLIRVAGMAAFAIGLAAALARTPGPVTAIGMVVVGVVGCVVLPIVGLSAPALMAPGTTTLAADLDPGTAGRWMAGAALVVAAVAALRVRGQPAPRPRSMSPVGAGGEPA